MLTASTAQPNPHLDLGVSPQIGSIAAPTPAPFSDSVHSGDNRAFPPVPNPDAALANNVLSHGAPGSLEGLLNAKQNTLAWVQAKFNEKILVSHQRLLEEQKRTFLEDEVKDHPLAQEVKRLNEDMEEQKFSFEVELAFEKNRVKQLEDDLKWEKGRDGAAAFPAVEFEVVKKLNDELQAEKDLRMEQLKSLEMLHFVELREIEKKHAESVSTLIASHQNEIKILKKSELKTDHSIRDDEKVSTQQDSAEFRGIEQNHAEIVGQLLVASYQNAIKVQKNELKSDRSIKDDEKVSTQHKCESSEERAAAAAALSSLAAPVASKLSSRTVATEDDSSSMPGSIHMPPTSNDWEQGLNNWKEMRRKKMNSTYKICTSKDHNALKRKKVETFNRAISDISDSDSGSESSKRSKSGQEEEVDDILRKAGIAPLDKDTPAKKNIIKKKNMLADNVKEYLKEWMMHPDHCEHPYPTPAEKATIMADTGMSFTELNNWFVNNRKRFWKNEVKPKIEEIKNAHRLREMKWSYEALNKSSSAEFHEAIANPLNQE